MNSVDHKEENNHELKLKNEEILSLKNTLLKLQKEMETQTNEFNEKLYKMKNTQHDLLLEEIK
jgi:hypothetical protein